MVASRRPPISWPGNARLSVNLSVTFETWPGDLGRPHSLQNQKSGKIPPDALFTKNLSVIMDRQFGERVGIFEIMDLLKREEIKATFWLNGVTVERFPQVAREILEHGHELASETYTHDYSFMKTPEQDRADIHKCVAAFQKAVGVRPLGYISPGHLPTDSTPAILAEEGYLYWSDPSQEELPYTLKVNGRNLVIMSNGMGVSDYTTFRDEGKTFRQVVEMWKDAFDWLYDKGSTYPTRMAVSMHPYLVGRPYRIKVLQEFIQYIKKFPDVWISPCIDVVNWWREKYDDYHVEEWPNYEVSATE